MLDWLIVNLGLAKHEYLLFGNSNRHICVKCGDIIYIPPSSEWAFRTFRGCKKR